MVFVRKKIMVFICLSLVVFIGCGGGGANSNSGGIVGGGSCSAMFTPFVNPSECWEYSTDESNAIAYCVAANGVYSTSACDETGKIATCTTLFPPGSLTGSLFTVYWFSGSYPLDFTTECSGTLSGALT